MDFGINLSPGAESWKTVQRAEELGFTHAWFVDSQLLNADVFVVMAAAAMRTSRIRLGTGMLIPSNRIAPVAANALASLNKLAPGRIVAGVATGNTARRTMGLGPISLAALERYIEVIQGMLAGRTVSFGHAGIDRKIRFLNPELGLIDIDHPIPLAISALGPRGRALAARLGANWTIPVGGNLDHALAAIEAMKTAWRDAGRDADTLYAHASAGGCVLDEGEPFDSARAVAQAGPAAAMFLHDVAEVSVHGDMVRTMPADLVEAYRQIYQGYQPEDARYLASNRGHLMVVRDEEAPLVTAELIRAMTFTGTAAALRDRIRALRDAGFAQFSTHIRYGQPQMLDAWADVVAGV